MQVSSLTLAVHFSNNVELMMERIQIDDASSFFIKWIVPLSKPGATMHAITGKSLVRDSDGLCY